MMGHGGGAREASWVAVAVEEQWWQWLGSGGSRVAEAAGLREGGGRAGGSCQGLAMKVAMLDRDGRSVAMSVAKEAVTMEGRNEAWRFMVEPVWEECGPDWSHAPK